MAQISCCKDCEKRHYACWDSCEEYQAQKKKNDKQRAADQISIGLTEQRSAAVRKANKGRRKRK